MSRTTDTLKSEGKYREAGANDFAEGNARAYGCHFGMRSGREAAIAEYNAGFDAAAAAAVSPTHYLITANKEAIGVTAKDEADARQRAEAMGIAKLVVRVDPAMSKEEWDARTEPAQKVIADYPAYTIIETDPTREWKDGEIFAVARQTRNHGTLWDFYTLGSVASYAKRYNEDPNAAVAQARERGHQLYWANLNGVSITAWKREKEVREAVEIGAAIRFEGKVFRVMRDGPHHVKLVEVA